MNTYLSFAWSGANLRADYWLETYVNVRHWPLDKRRNEGLKRRAKHKKRQFTKRRRASDG